MRSRPRVSHAVGMGTHKKARKGDAITVRLEPKLRAKLEALAARQGMKLGPLLRRLAVEELGHADLMAELRELEPDDGDDR